MDGETVDFIEVERFDGDTEYLIDSQIDLVLPKSIRWMSPDEARHICRLNKSAMQLAVSDLLSVHGIPKEVVRRGQARRTEYSETAVDLIKALKSGKQDVFQELKAKIKASFKGDVGAIVCVTEHFEVAVAATDHANKNRQLIHQEMGTLLTKFDILADAIGDKIVARMDERITEKVRAGIKKMGES